MQKDVSDKSYICNAPTNQPVQYLTKNEAVLLTFQILKGIISVIHQPPFFDYAH